jgi:hypothetical protein
MQGLQPNLEAKEVCCHHVGCTTSLLGTLSQEEVMQTERSQSLKGTVLRRRFSKRIWYRARGTYMSSLLASALRFCWLLDYEEACLLQASAY